MNENNRGLPRYSYYLKIIETTLETSREHKLSLITDKQNEILQNAIGKWMKNTSEILSFNKF